jgi:hypothetical protein
MRKKELTTDKKKAILLKHYTFDEICEIMGFYDGSNEDVCTPEINTAYETDNLKFEQLILNEAIINGNFEEVITTDKRHAL